MDDDTNTPKMGRPTEYTPEIGDLICERLSEGFSLRSVVKGEGMPAASTVFRWMRQNEDFRLQYADAKRESADAMAEDILDIADDGTNDYMTIIKGDKEKVVFNGEHYNRSRLRVDTRKWLMSKMMPKRYGDKLDVTSDGKALPAPLLGGLSVADDPAAKLKELEDGSGDTNDQ